MDFAHADRAQGELPDEYKPYFQGRAKFQMLNSPFGAEPAVFVVHFDAGGRTRPHVHRSGQLLYIADGEASWRPSRSVARSGRVTSSRSSPTSGTGTGGPRPRR